MSKNKTPALKGSAAARRLHPRLHHHPEEAELRLRKVARVRLSSGVEVTAYIPGVGVTTSGALDRARPRRSCEGPPGVRYKIIRGTLDTQGVKNRKQARSRYGAKKEKS